MVTESIFYAVSMISAAFFVIYGMKLKRYIPPYQGRDLVVAYLLTRVLPVFMLQTIPPYLGVSIVLDVGVLLFLRHGVLRLTGERASVLANNAAMVYLYQPISTLLVVSGNSMGMLLVFAVAAVLLVVVWSVKRKRKGYKKQGRPERVIPAPEEAEGEDICIGHISFKDIVAMLLISVAFLCLGLWRLGSMQVPETTQVLQLDGNRGNEMVLDFGKEVSVSKISIYLGYMGKRKLSFSYYDTDAKQWVAFAENHVVESAFTWNPVKVGKTMRYLGIVGMDAEAQIQEIVILGEGEERLLPVNYMEYERAFDEQELYVHKHTYYDGTMFDEIYHGRTAYEFLHKLPIYENTHPPLGKTIISIGIALFGMNPFGFRIMCVICGTLMIPFMYLFAFRLSRRTHIAVLAAVLLATEFMHFALSRIATIDIIVALFVLMMYYFMYCYIDACRQGKAFVKGMLWLLPCGISMGCAIAVKWTGVYAAVGIAIWFFIHLLSYLNLKPQEFNGQCLKELAKLATVCVLCFVGIPAIIYVLSYIPFTQVYGDKSLLQHVFDNGKSMLDYHAATVFEHPYSSEWYEWVIDRVSLLDAYVVLEDGKISAIATFGSPLVIWGGIVAGIYNLYLWRCKGSKESGYLILGYLAMLVPWLFVHRTVFIYQYYICTLFLILMIVNGVKRIKTRQKWVSCVIMLVSTGLFVLFYPVLSGYPVSPDWVNQALEWLDTWRFAL